MPAAPVLLLAVAALAVLALAMATGGRLPILTNLMLIPLTAA